MVVFPEQSDCPIYVNAVEAQHSTAHTVRRQKYATACPAGLDWAVDKALCQVVMPPIGQLQ